MIITSRADITETFTVTLHFSPEMTSDERKWIVQSLKLIIAHEAKALKKKVRL